MDVSSGAGLVPATPQHMTLLQGLTGVDQFCQLWVQVGLGGAAPQNTVEPIRMAPPQSELVPLADGVYTIRSFVRGQTPGCRRARPAARRASSCLLGAWTGAAAAGLSASPLAPSQATCAAATPPADAQRRVQELPERAPVRPVGGRE